MTEASRILIGDVRDGLRSLPAGSVHCCVTSPPYWGLRDYGVEGQIGLEPTPDAFVASMVEVFREVRRVLRDDGTLWLNLGDSYAGSTTGADDPNQRRYESGAVKTATAYRKNKRPESGFKPKDLCMMPWRVALALQADGWWIRSVIVWAKKSPMPESVTDRPTSSWEPIFLLAKNERYWYDAEAVKETAIHAGAVVTNDGGKNGDMGKYGATREGFMKEGGVVVGDTRNLRNVWHLGPEPYAEAHFATFPTEIPRRAIKAGTSEKGCCPTCGAGWVRVLDKQKSARTVGWSQSCECPPAEPVPCLVLDPFLGSGTTVAVARTLGRHGVGCELNPKYAELARVRIGKAEKPDTFVDPRVKDSPLFAETK